MPTESTPPGPPGPPEPSKKTKEEIPDEESFKEHHFYPRHRFIVRVPDLATSPG